MNQPGFFCKGIPTTRRNHARRSLRNRAEGVWKLVSTVRHVIHMNFRDAEEDLPWSRSGAWALDLSERVLPALHGPGLAADPAVYRLITSGQSVTASSADEPAFTEPKDISALKLDFGIRRLSAGVRGEQGTCSYFAFSNFDASTPTKLASPRYSDAAFSLCYMRCSSPLGSLERPAHPTCCSVNGKKRFSVGWRRANRWKIVIPGLV